MQRSTLLASFLAALTLSGGCDGEKKPEPRPPEVVEVFAPEPTPPDRGLDAPPVFEERAEAAGVGFRMRFIPTEQGENFKINLYDHGAGVAVGDYDGDGRDDLYFCNQLGPNALYRNEGGGKFTETTALAGADLALTDRMCVGAAFDDYDGDGRQDLFVTTTRAGNVLFHNEGGGKFTDVTAKAGVTLVAHSEACAFFDADRDGDLDLFVANTAKWTSDQLDPALRYHPGLATLMDLIKCETEEHVYFRNGGDGTFTDATAEAGLAGTGWGGDCVVFDHDADGDPDLFVSNMFGRSQLFANDGKGRFTDVTKAVLGRVPFGALGAQAFDFDGDGRLDLYVTDMHSDMWITKDTRPEDIQPKRRYAAFNGPLLASRKVTPEQEKEFADLAHLDYAAVVFGNALYRNLGKGSFEEVAEKAGAETFWPWGVAAADFRNVGRDDAFVPSGMGNPFFFWPNEYLLNRGDGTFAASGAAAGFDPPPGGRLHEEAIGGERPARSSRSAATADFDGDGRVDLVVNNFNDRAWLYMNRTPARNWVAFRLTGTKSNRDAIGAVVTLRAGGRTFVRQVNAVGGYLAQSSKTVHFGLGDEGAIQSVEIAWPSGSRQTVERPQAGRRHDVTEP